MPQLSSMLRWEKCLSKPAHAAIPFSCLGSADSSFGRMAPSKELSEFTGRSEQDGVIGGVFQCSRCSTVKVVVNASNDPANVGANDPANVDAQAKIRKSFAPTFAASFFPV